MWKIVMHDTPNEIHAVVADACSVFVVNHSQHDTKEPEVFANDAARIIGISPRALRRYMRETGRNQSDLKGARYEFTHTEVERIAAEYWGSRRKPVIEEDEDTDTSAPGLDPVLLQDSSAREQFRLIRRQREARLNDMLRAVGLSVPQMSDDFLVRTGRAMNAEVLR